MTINENIKALRLLNVLTQSDLARKAKQYHPRMTAKTICSIETGARDPSPAEADALAKALGVPESDLHDPDAMVPHCQGEPVLLELAATFGQACGLRAMEALSALETRKISNDTDLSNPDATRYVPPVRHDGRTHDWKKDERDLRFLAGFHALFRPETKSGMPLPDQLASDEFHGAVAESAMLQDVRPWDVDERAMLASVASLYVAYIAAGTASGRNVKYSDAEKAINAAMSAGRKNA